MVIKFPKRLKGLTLIEMMVALGIMSIGMLSFSLLFLNSWKTNKFVIETGVSAIQVNRAVDNIVNNLRKIKQADNGDYPIESGDKFDLKVYSDIDNDGTTERVHYWLDSGTKQIKQGITEPAGTPSTYAAGDGAVNVIANNIVNTNAQPVFYYYNQNYPGDTTNNPLSTPLSVQDARLIRVLLHMNIDPLHAPDYINVETFVDLRNLEHYGE